MSIDKYLYEIIDDYKNASSKIEKTEIFNDFCRSIWGSKNKRRVYTKSIKFKVRDDLLNSDIGQIFNSWSEIEYKGYKSMTKDADWSNLIRQKINNLYTRYFDDEVILNKDYMEKLNTPRNLYYKWIDGVEMNKEELTNTIDNAIHNAEELRLTYKKQKMKLSWDEYKRVIEGFLQKTFNNCKLIDNYEEKNKLISIYDLSTEDNFYVKYICNSLETYILNYQKESCGLKRGRNKKYKHCKECGILIEKNHNRIQYCDKCKREMELKRYKKYNKKRNNHN